MTPKEKAQELYNKNLSIGMNASDKEKRIGALWASINCVEEILNVLGNLQGSFPAADIIYWQKVKEELLFHETRTWAHA